MSNVYTCTMNLAIDLFIETTNLYPFQLNRSVDDDIQANGKGVNVSLVMNLLDMPSTALGFKAGFTGDYVEKVLKEKGIKTAFLSVEGMTRINVFTKVIETKLEYKLVNSGPYISRNAQNKLLKKIATLHKGDYLCVSGSLPKGISPNLLVKISELCQEKGINFILDTSYVEVMDCLPFKPYLLKPNEEEIAAWFGKKINTMDDYILYGRQLIQRGAQHVLLSLGSKGAFFFSEKELLYANAPQGVVVNTACAGDTLLATFLTGMIRGSTQSKNLKRSVAAASSTAFTKGLTDFSDVAELEKEVRVKKEAPI